MAGRFSSRTGQKARKSADSAETLMSACEQMFSNLGFLIIQISLFFLNLVAVRFPTHSFVSESLCRLTPHQT